MPLIKQERTPQHVVPDGVSKHWSPSQVVARSAAGAYGSAAAVMGLQRNAFILSTSLPYADKFRLHWRLGQVPQLWRTPQPASADLNLDQRRWTVPRQSRNAFKACALALVPQQGPTAYIEGRAPLGEHATALPRPTRPRLIWTRGLHNSNAIFKLWAAEVLERGSTLVISQHVRLYGVGRWSFGEDHEIAISDRYLSWSWEDASQPTVKAVGQLKSRLVSTRVPANPSSVQRGFCMMTVWLVRERKVAG